MTKSGFFQILLIGTAASGVALADLSLTPADAITGTPGATVGWGYSITNPTNDWLETIGLTAPSFSFGTPNAIFDFPVVAPMSTVTEDFSLVALNNGCVSLPCGIYDVTLPLVVPSSPTITGDFTVPTELFGSNPLTDPNANDLGAGPTFTAQFSVTEIPGTATAPEPAENLAVGAILALLIAWRVYKYRRATPEISQ